MAHMQYIPSDQTLVDQIVYELKSKGIFDKFRKECISDVDTRPAYQNLRQRVESSVATFLSHQIWKPDMNKNQLREKLRKHILDGNYLEQGVERIVDQVVNPKVASVFIPQVEELVYNYLGIPRRKTATTVETSNGKANTETDTLPTDLEAVSPGSVHSNQGDKNETVDISIIDPVEEENKMEVDQESNKPDMKDKGSKSPVIEVPTDKHENAELVQESQPSSVSDLSSQDSIISMDKSLIPLPAEEIKLENIPPPVDSPPKKEIEIPIITNISMDIPLPDDSPPQNEEKMEEKDLYHFKPITSDNDDSSSDSSLRRNVSPLTPIRNYNNENSCDALQGFDNDSRDNKSEDKKGADIPVSSFRFTIEAKESLEAIDDVPPKEEKKIDDATTAQAGLSYQFQNQMNLNPFNTPMYDDSSSSNNLHIDYESDINSKTNNESKVLDVDQTTGDVQEAKPKESKTEEKKTNHKTSHNSRDSHRHSSSSKDKRSDSKHSSSKDRRDPKTDKKSLKDDRGSGKSSKSNHRERSRDRSDKKDSRDSSRHRHSSSKSTLKDSKSSHKSSSSTNQRHTSSSKHSDDKKSSSHRDKNDKSDAKTSRDNKPSRDSSRHSSSHRSDKDKKSSSSKSKHSDDKEKKNKKVTDDHYSASGRGNNSRRSTDRDSNDGNSSSSKGSNMHLGSRTAEVKKENKNSKSDNTSSSSETTSQSDHLEPIINDNSTYDSDQNVLQGKPVVRVEHLGKPIVDSPNITYPSEIKLKKPKIAANMEEARKIMKMRKLIEMEQRKMNQDAALLLEFQQNVRPGLSQVYSTLSGPELEFVCFTNNNGGGSSLTQQIVQNSNITYTELNGNENTHVEDCKSGKEKSEMISKISRPVDEENTHCLKVDVKFEQVDDELPKKIAEDLYNTEPNHISETVKNESNEEPTDSLKSNENKDDKEYVEVAVIAEESSENEKFILQLEADDVIKIQNIESEMCNVQEDVKQTTRTDSEPCPIQFVETKNSITSQDDIKNKQDNEKVYDEFGNTKVLNTDVVDNNSWEDHTKDFHYFGEEDIYKVQLERDQLTKFYSSYANNLNEKVKIHILNCDSHVTNLIKEVSCKFGDYEIVNFNQNGRLYSYKVDKPAVKELSIVCTREITIPITKFNGNLRKSSPVRNCFQNAPVFSPIKSDSSYELSSDYDAKLQEMVNKASRQEIMEIILGTNVADNSNVMPEIDIFNGDILDRCRTVKRKLSDDETNDNNNRNVLTPNKIRKTSESDQITSTTEDNDKEFRVNSQSVTRSKYSGKAKRVGLSRPKKMLPNSPSSDKSIENYEQNNKAVTKSPQLNGKIKNASSRSKIQRYDTTDLYKPQLHFLSRRHNVN